MEPIEYLDALRRRWRAFAAVVAAALIAGSLGALLFRGADAQEGFEVAATVAYIPAGGLQLPQIVQAATGPEVAGDAARRAGDEASPEAMRRSVEVEGDQTVGGLIVRARGRSPQEARARAVAYAEAIVGFVTSSAQRPEEAPPVPPELIRRADRLVQQKQKLRAQAIPRVRETRSTLALDRLETALTIRLDSLNEDLTIVREQIARLTPPAQSSTVAAGPRAFLGRVSAPTNLGSGPLGTPPGLLRTLAASLLLGALAALVVVYLLERADPILRTRQAAVRATGFPLWAEVPSGNVDASAMRGELRLVASIARSRSASSHTRIAVLSPRPTSGGAMVASELRAVGGDGFEVVEGAVLSDGATLPPLKAQTDLLVVELDGTSREDAQRAAEVLKLIGQRDAALVVARPQTDLSS
ncbi:MAG: hypothetical protein ABR575_11165 [Actinomycetota bacterium]